MKITKLVRFSVYHLAGRVVRGEPAGDRIWTIDNADITRRNGFTQEDLENF